MGTSGVVAHTGLHEPFVSFVFLLGTSCTKALLQHPLVSRSLMRGFFEKVGVNTLGSGLS